MSVESFVPPFFKQDSNNVSSSGHNIRFAYGSRRIVATFRGWNGVFGIEHGRFNRLVFIFAEELKSEWLFLVSVIAESQADFR